MNRKVLLIVSDCVMVKRIMVPGPVGPGTWLIKFKLLLEKDEHTQRSQLH